MPAGVLGETHHIPVALRRVGGLQVTVASGTFSVDVDLTQAPAAKTYP